MIYSRRPSNLRAVTKVLSRSIVEHYKEKPVCTALKGVAFPVDANGERKTSAAGMAVIAAAIKGSGAPGCEGLSISLILYNTHKT